MTNIGACAGIVGAHGYFQYTGERQKAYTCLDRSLKRRSLEFWAIFWDKQLMARFNPLVQQYIRHNGIWYTYHLPHKVLDQPDNYGGGTVKKKTSTDAQASEQPPEEKPYYTQPYDYANNLRQIDAELTRSKINDLEIETEALLKEAEYLLYVAAQKEYEYCHLKNMDADERQVRLQEIQLLRIAYNRVHVAANANDVKITKWEKSLKHKLLFEAHSSGEDTLEAWLPATTRVDHKTHDPTLSIQEMEKCSTEISAGVKRFEELCKHPGYEQRQKERWKKDLEDGRTMLKAVDHVLWELEKKRKALEERKVDGKIVESVTPTQQTEVAAAQKGMTAEAKVEKTEAGAEDKQAVKTRVDKAKATKPPSGSLEPDKP